MKPSEYGGKYTRTPPDSQSQGLNWQILAVGRHEAFHSLCDQAVNGLVIDGGNVSAHHARNVDEVKEMACLIPQIALFIVSPEQGKDNRIQSLIRWLDNIRKNIPFQIAFCSLDGEHKFCYPDSPDIHHRLPPCPSVKEIEVVVRDALNMARAFRRLGAELTRHIVTIQEKEAQLNDLIRSIGDIVWQTGPDGRFTQVSANVKTIYGYTQRQFIGRSFDFGMTQETRIDSWPEISQAIQNRQPFTNVEISRTHKDGEPRYFLTSGLPFYGPGGQWKGFKGAEKEITALVHSEQEKKKLIAQLRHAQRLEAMGTLAGGIAHDFNNILGGILGYTQLIQFEIRDNPVALSYTEHIIAGCNRAKNLILQILDFSRQRESAGAPKVTDPGEIVCEAVKLLRASIPSSIKLKIHIDKTAGLILADPSQIHQAVMNLCTNARQAIETAMGTITIAVGKISLTPENHTRSPDLDLEFGNYVTVSVTDTGNGIESNTLEKIFNPYFTTKKRGDGTGLGLSVVHGIVTRFNGIIDINTVPGQGSTFTLYFPSYEKKKPPNHEPRPRIIEGQSRVLFIDDEPMLVDIGRMMLEKLGYRVMALNSPMEGLEMIEADPGRFDIVITDMTMPDILGTQLALKIKEINPSIPVILATGFSNIVQTQKATPAGIDAVLPKPITMASLSQTLYQTLYQILNT